MHKSAMICDLAETYHIYDYRGLPVQLLATLVFGLRADSRTKMEINGTTVPSYINMLAGIIDRLSLLVWQNTEDGHKNRNRPQSLLELLNAAEEKNSITAFNSGEEFDKAYAELTGRARGE